MSRPSIASDLRQSVDYAYVILRIIKWKMLSSAHHNYVSTDERKKVVDRDLNGDGRADVVFADYANSLGVLISKGDGNFAAGVSYPIDIIGNQGRVNWPQLVSQIASGLAAQDVVVE